MERRSSTKNPKQTTLPLFLLDLTRIAEAGVFHHFDVHGGGRLLSERGCIRSRDAGSGKELANQHCCSKVEKAIVRRVRIVNSLNRVSDCFDHFSLLP